MLKLLLIGNSGVGKSCILMQFSENKFTNNFYNTIGVDYVPRSITQKVKYVECDGQKVKLQIWDTVSSRLSVGRPGNLQVNHPQLLPR
mgnify:CR=1 FL=1